MKTEKIKWGQPPIAGRNRRLTPFNSKVFAHIAQSVEHFLGKEEVTGSNPVMGSRTILKAVNSAKR